ncbi:unnamed protein product [Bursaphelenchus xylophilus]|uniref:(pine wood nematode) hypothetical protein n=1 Tax=Bursaphelenchus xylophilus TaxID=6326 RepID=A0A811JY85_BURXY|nr:unnamed protein product [Bursaphelenchus xylophilus]CAG9080610.1 unnamed protein product [Bursaphelenchus xylophilus]
MPNPSSFKPSTSSWYPQTFRDWDSRIEKTEFYRKSIKKALSDPSIMSTLTSEQVYLLRNGRMAYVTEGTDIEYKFYALEKRLRGRILQFYHALDKDERAFGVDIWEPLMDEFAFEKEIQIDHYSASPSYVYGQIMIRDPLPSQDEAFKAFQLLKEHPLDMKKPVLRCNYCDKQNHVEKNCFKKKRDLRLGSKMMPELQEQLQSEISHSDLNDSPSFTNESHLGSTPGRDSEGILPSTDTAEDNWIELLQCYQELPQENGKEFDIKDVETTTQEQSQGAKTCDLDQNFEGKREDRPEWEYGDFETLFDEPEAPSSRLIKVNYQTDYSSELSKSVFMTWSKKKVKEDIDFMDVLDDSLYHHWINEDGVEKKCFEIVDSRQKDEFQNDFEDLEESRFYEWMSSFAFHENVQLLDNRTDDKSSSNSFLPAKGCKFKFLPENQSLDNSLEDFNSSELSNYSRIEGKGCKFKGLWKDFDHIKFSCHEIMKSGGIERMEKTIKSDLGSIITSSYQKIKGKGTKFKYLGILLTSLVYVYFPDRSRRTKLSHDCSEAIVNQQRASSTHLTSGRRQLMGGASTAGRGNDTNTGIDNVDNWNGRISWSEREPSERSVADEEFWEKRTHVAVVFCGLVFVVFWRIKVLLNTWFGIDLEKGQEDRLVL